MSDITFETYEHAGLTVKLVYDPEGGFDPLDDDGRIGQFAVEYRGYNLGGADNIDPSEIWENERECPACVDCPGWVKAGSEHALAGSEPDEDGDVTCGMCGGSRVLTEDPIAFIKREYGARVILPLFVLDHSGITIKAGGRLDTGEDNLRSTNRFISDGAGWDTSTVGVIFDTAERRKACGLEDWTDEQIEEGLRAVVQEHAYALEGYYTGYVIEDADGNDLDSCWGFLGPPEYSGIKEQADNAAECAAREIEREKARVFEAACRDIITVEAMT